MFGGFFFLIFFFVLIAKFIFLLIHCRIAKFICFDPLFAYCYPFKFFKNKYFNSFHTNSTFFSRSQFRIWSALFVLKALLLEPQIQNITIKQKRSGNNLFYWFNNNVVSLKLQQLFVSFFTKSTLYNIWSYKKYKVSIDLYLQTSHQYFSWIKITLSQSSGVFVHANIWLWQIFDFFQKSRSVTALGNNISIIWNSN